MKANLRCKLIGLVALAGFAFWMSTPSRAEEQAPKRISADETLSYTNHPHKAIVTGRVVEVFETDKAVHLNFGKPRPDQNFTILVTASKAPSFPGLREMKGKTVEATGFISASQGKPIMYMSEAKDLKITAEKQ